jgi:hypothetical protein
MQLAVIINSIVCAVGAIAGLLFAGASIISIANMTVSWSGRLIVAALLVPAAFVVSGIGAWLAASQGAAQLAIGFIGLPWVYGAIFIVLMLVAFKG